MRKAFAKNVALRRPQLRRAATVEGLAPGAEQPVALVSRTAPPPPAAGDADGWLMRLEKIKRAVAELAPPAPRVELEKIRRRVIRPAPSAGPLPAVSARDAGDVLSRVEALGAELARTHQALRGELRSAGADEARAAGEARAATERLTAAYADYLLQVAVRQRTRLAQASGVGRPAAVQGRGSSAEAEREARQPDLERALERAAREGVEASAPPPQQAGEAAFRAPVAVPLAAQRRAQRPPGGEQSPSREQRPELGSRRLHCLSA